MRTLAQQQEQIKFIINTLQLGLGRMLSINFGDLKDKKTIVLHCAMILFYQKLDRLLTSPKFISLFNKNLSHLLHEEKCAELFSQLMPPYKFDLPPELTSQELFIMIKFSSVLLLEAQKILDHHETRKTTLLKISFGEFLLSMTLYCVLAGWLSPKQTAFFPLLYSSLILLLLSFITLLLTRCRSQMHHELQPFQYPANILHLTNEIEANKLTIYPEVTFDLPNIPDLLPPSKLKNNAFGLIQSMFFKTEKLYINDHDLEASNQQVVFNTLCHL